MTEKVVIPEPDTIDIVPRKLSDKKPGDYFPYDFEGASIPEFVRAGDGYKFHTTGLTHDKRGYPVMSSECQEWNVRHLIDKIRSNADDIVRYDEEDLDGADVVVIAYGITSRVTRMGIDMARKKGVKVGFIRLIVVWPFPETLVRKLASKVKAFVVPEINYGQIVLEVERCAAGKAAAIGVPHGGGGVHDPECIFKAIMEAAK
jgi:2-oxoglutarate ferredoxin oxidoreductase subunit alpha